MYLVRTELMVHASYTAQFEERLRELAETTKGTSGYLGLTALHSYSHPGKYAVTQRFANVDAAWEYGKGEDFAAAVKSQPEDSVTVSQQEGYDAVLEVDAEPMPSVGCEILVDEVLKGLEVTPAFEATLGELFELRKKHARGYGTNRLQRSRGSLGRYLVIQGYTDLEAASRANTAPEVQAFIRDHPASLFTDEAVHPEAYGVLYRV
jgi:quinol monooxygenase YgiN